jgi:hypothetical protein
MAAPYNRDPQRHEAELLFRQGLGLPADKSQHECESAEKAAEHFLPQEAREKSGGAR